MLQKLRKYTVYVIFFLVIFPILFLICPTAWIHAPLIVLEKVSSWIYHKIRTARSWAVDSWERFTYEQWLADNVTRVINRLAGVKTMEEREEEMKKKIRERRKKRADRVKEK